MKQKDIALFIVIAFVSAVISLIVSNQIISTPTNREQKVEVIDPITADFPTPDSKYFNTNALDPTQLIQIGDNTNPQPFKGQNK
jgi:hypothetical protein